MIGRCDRLISRNLWLDLGRKRPVPHESWFFVAGYFFYFGHYYGAGCIAQLPERLRRVVRAGLDGERPAELAEEMSTTVGAIYNLHYRANQLLRECLKKGPV